MNILLFMATSEVYVLPFFIRRKGTKSFFASFPVSVSTNRTPMTPRPMPTARRTKQLPVSVALTLAGSLESVVISVNVQG